MRGLGPAKRAPEVRASLAVRMENVRHLEGDRGPLRARRAWVVAVWWLLREVELAGLSAHQSSVRCWKHKGKRRVTLFLPLTKMDQRGRGAARTWECICGEGNLKDGDVSPSRDDSCPACVVHDQVDEVARLHQVAHTENRARDVPLFPTVGGKVPSKKEVVGAWGDLLTDAAVDWDPTEEGE